MSQTVGTTSRASDDVVATGRVLQVNVSPGGVPKLPVERAWVGKLGVEGDKHREDTVHGGPLRAVCLFAIEVIERLQAEGHPVEPGSVGENLTTSGVEWSTLPAGTRARIGERLLIELVAPALPCDTQRPNFARGQVNRISHVLHPSDSRMYASVLEEGEVRAGDQIAVLPPAPGNDPGAQIRAFRLDDAERRADLGLWAAAAAGGLDIRVLDDGELVAAAAPDVADDPWNHALGLRTLPQLLPRVLDHYRRHAARGQFGMPSEPWPGAERVFELGILAAVPVNIAAGSPAPLPTGVTIRRLEPHEWAAFASVALAVFEESGMQRRPWEGALRYLLAQRDYHAVIAEREGVPIATGALVTHKRVGLLRAGMVLPEARGHGLQRALIAERVRLALELGCDLIGSAASVDGISERNLIASGLVRVATRDVYRFDPAADPVPHLTEMAA